MAYRYYRILDGYYLTVIVDDLIYDTVNQMNVNNIAVDAQGNVTAIGLVAQQICENVYATTLYNVRPPVDFNRWRYETILPNIFYRQILASGYNQSFSERVDINDDFYWNKVYTMPREGVQGLSASWSMVQGRPSTVQLAQWDTCLPVGFCTGDGAVNNDYISSGFIIINSTYTNSIVVTVRGYGNSRVEFMRMTQNSSQTAAIAHFIDEEPVYIFEEPEDPYPDIPSSGQASGEPDPNPQDDDIELEPLPTMSFADAGFCRIYRPSVSQLQALANYMWTDSTFLQTLINHAKQILENPIEAIISLSLVPCVPSVSTDVPVKVMYINTGVDMPPVTSQFVRVDCGAVVLKERYASALDYNPYTKVQLYLPYIGTVQLDTDEVMNKTIHVYYNIDVVTGLCCACVQADADVLYQFSGHCSISQPITAADFSGYLNAALAAGKMVAAIAAAGAGAPTVAASLVSAPTPSISGTETKTTETTRNPETGRQITTGTQTTSSQHYNPGASFGEVAARGLSNTVGAVMGSKTTIQHTGGFSGNSGYMAGVRRPYLIVEHPNMVKPENYGKYNGRPSMIYLRLGDCEGYTQVQTIQLTGIDATNPELSEISTLLMAGVIM